MVLLVSSPNMVVDCAHVWHCEVHNVHIWHCASVQSPDLVLRSVQCPNMVLRVHCAHIWYCEHTQQNMVLRMHTVHIWHSEVCRAKYGTVKCTMSIYGTVSTLYPYMALREHYVHIWTMHTSYVHSQYPYMAIYFHSQYHIWYCKNTMSKYGAASTLCPYMALRGAQCPNMVLRVHFVHVWHCERTQPTMVLRSAQCPYMALSVYNAQIWYCEYTVSIFGTAKCRMPKYGIPSVEWPNMVLRIYNVQIWYKHNLSFIKRVRLFRHKKAHQSFRNARNFSNTTPYLYNTRTKRGCLSTNLLIAIPILKKTW
jgi:hypothetical protein